MAKASEEMVKSLKVSFAQQVVSSFQFSTPVRTNHQFIYLSALLLCFLSRWASLIVFSDRSGAQ